MKTQKIIEKYPGDGSGIDSLFDFSAVPLMIGVSLAWLVDSFVSGAYLQKILVTVISAGVLAAYVLLRRRINKDGTVALYTLCTVLATVAYWMAK
ncbi:MAG: hypothetical protein MUD08_00855 [Cytophagales bacterium]|jgi:hypothetical protein|nr:hypothetical protein [Cytophagales bacterium]